MPAPAPRGPEKKIGPFAGGIGVAVWLNSVQGDDGSARRVSSITLSPRRYRDRQTGEIAKDAVSGEALMTLGVVYIEEGESSLIKVTVPEGGVSEGLALPRPVGAGALAGAGALVATAGAGRVIGLETIFVGPVHP